MQQLKQTGPRCGFAGAAAASLNAAAPALPMAARQHSGPVLALNQLVVRYPGAASSTLAGLDLSLLHQCFFGKIIFLQHQTVKKDSQVSLRATKGHQRTHKNIPKKSGRRERSFFRSLKIF